MDSMERLLCAIAKAQQEDPTVRVLDGSVVCLTSSISTIEISPGYISANPEWIHTSSNEELIFMLRHDARHITKDHFERRRQIMEQIKSGRILTAEARVYFRRPNRATKWIALHLLWNIAADFEINKEIECEQLHSTGGLCIGYRDFKSFPISGQAEEHFDILCNWQEWRMVAVNFLKEKGFLDEDYEQAGTQPVLDQGSRKR